MSNSVTTMSSAEVARESMRELCAIRLTWYCAPLVQRKFRMIRCLSQLKDESLKKARDAHWSLMRVPNTRATKLRREALQDTVETAEQEVRALELEIDGILQQIDIVLHDDGIEMERVEKVVHCAIEEEAANRAVVKVSENGDRYESPRDAKKVRHGFQIPSQKEARNSNNSLQRILEDSNDMDDEEEDEIISANDEGLFNPLDQWCVCRKVDDGTYMVGCDNGKFCEVKWWHPQCAIRFIDNSGIGAKPPKDEADAQKKRHSTWVCPKCIVDGYRQPSTSRTVNKRRRGNAQNNTRSQEEQNLEFAECQ